ncbi:hypothetical protein DXD27_23985 [Bacteroides intestinalis]|uniref:hypothetical protein n=1 Tax=Bacteroides intestinalis TaxID=329854 RepID=UPI000E436030|nr:hypothetical protein [Bacteroides intestinalis]RGK18763.1 hypothetical protein DXD27_23985 [Bacteroides intestinalis]
MAFAACSNEDFVNEVPSLEARGTIDVTLNVKKPTVWTADTRLGINENYKFVWEKDVDMIGAAVADGAVLGDINTDHKVPYNYAFSALTSAETSSFNGKSPISQGHYLFYYGYTDILDRGYLDLSVPAQTYKVEDTKTAIQQAVSRMKMIAPIVNLADGVNFVDAQTYNLNLSFVNLYTLVRVTVNSENFPDGVTPKLEKITLNTKTGSSVGFVKNAHANLAVIAGNSKANVVTPGADGMLVEGDMTEAKEKVNELILNASNSGVSTIYDQTGVDNSDKSGPVTLSIDGDLSLSTTEPTVLYLLAPKGTYNGGLTLTVETSEGTYTRDIERPSGKDLTLGDDIQGIAAGLDFSDGSGNVTLPESFPIASADDWAHAVDFVNSHSVAYIGETVEFALNADIEVSTLPAFPLSIIGSKTLTLADDYVMTEKSAAKFTASGIKLGVKAGATLTLDAAVAFESIVNNGILNVNADQTIGITNYGTMNVASKNVSLSGGVTNGDDTEEIKGIINIAKDKVLTIETAALNNKVGDINVKGELVVNSASANAGTITNDGTISGSAAITNTGTIKNNAEGTISATNAIVNADGIIDNFGTLKTAVTNADGKVIIEKDSKSNSLATITGGTVDVKDVTTFATTQTGAEKYTFTTAVVTTSVNNKGEYAAADAAGVGVTNITLSGSGWSLANSAGEDDTKIIAVPSQATITGLTLKDATLDIEVALGKP